MFFLIPSSAEYILVKKQGTDLNSISYNTLTDAERAEVDKIYSDILMTYQWPMITMHYPNWDKETQAEVLDSLKNSDNKFALFTIARQKLQQQYQDRYELIYTPDTIFEIATLIQFAKENINRTTEFPKDDLRNASYGFNSDFALNTFEGTLAETLAKASNLKLDTEKQYAYFLNQGYGVHNERPEIKNLYFETSKYLVDTYKTDLNREDRINDIVKELLENYISLSPSFLNAIQKVNANLLTVHNLADQYVGSILNINHLSLLKIAAHLHFIAEKNNHFNLFRGTEGVRLNAEQQLLDAPTREFKKEYNSVSGTSASLNKIMAYRYNIKKPEALPDSPANAAPDNFSPTSLSFGNTILSGSVYEASGARQAKGARPLDFIKAFDKGYALNIPISSYLETPSVAQDFFVSPFNTVMSLFGFGELFHSRSKISLYSPGYVWSGYIIGIANIKPETHSNRSDIILQDLASGLGYLVRPGIEWPRLSGLITHDIGRFAKLISIVNNEDINNLHKNFGLFEFEATGLREHLAKYQNVISELKKSDLSTLLKSGSDRDVYKRRLEKCREIINNLSQSFTDVQEQSKQQKIQEILKNASGDLEHVGQSPENLNTDPFEEFMGKINKDLMSVLMTNSLDIKSNPLELYKNYKAQVSKEIAKKLRSKSPAFNWQDAPDNRIYDQNNVFEKIIKDPQRNLRTTLYENSKDVMAFDDLRKRTAEHFIVIPKGPYISLPHFTIHANSIEMVDLLRTIADIAEAKGLDKTGYRVISNHAVNPGTSSTNNDANQEVPHFHIHVAGGECLGKPVAQKATDNSILYSENMPFGLGLSAKELVRVAYQNEIATEKLDYKGQTLTLLAYSLPDKRFNVPVYFGIIVLDEKQNPFFHSFQDFAKSAEAPLITAFFNFISKLAQASGVHDSGYRILSNTGPDAWEYPEVFQLFIAGGAPLGPTVTNVNGNHKQDMTDNTIYDFADLVDYNHEHCLSLYEFNKSHVDPNKLEDLQRKNRVLYIDNVRSIQFIERELNSIPAYISDLQSQALTALQQKIVTRKVILYKEAAKALPGIVKDMKDLEKYDLEYKEYPSFKENQKFYKIGQES